MKKKLPPCKRVILSTLMMVLFSSLSKAQTVTIDANSSQSGNIVVGLNNNHVSENIYTEAEIGATNFTSAAKAIDHIDLSVYAVGNPTTINNFKLYLKEVPLTTTTFTTGVYNTTGYTLVYNGTVNFNSLGWAGIDLTTSFQRTSGNNLQLLIERSDNLPHTGFSFNAANGNETGSAGINSSRRVNIASIPVPGTTSLTTASPARPRIQFRHISQKDARISQVYTLGKLPVPFATPHIIKSTIVNSGSGTITNLPVTLTISGANSFNDVQTIPSLLPGDTVIVSFSAFTPASTGVNTVNVSLPADDYTGDNSFSVAQVITSNAYNHASGTVATGATGFSVIAATNPAGTGDFAALFTTSSPTSVNQVGVSFATGGQPFKVVIWDKSGIGKPGAVLWESTTQTSTAGVFTLPISPAIPVTDSFYVGIRQTNNVNIQFAYQSENPARPNTFFNAFPTGSSAWIDLAPTSPFRFMIEPRLTLANDVGIATITNPVAATNVDNCGLTPQVVVSNFGSANQATPFNVTYLIKQGGAMVYTDTKSLTLNSGLSQNVEFTTFAGSVTGADSSIVYTSLATDAANNNDTVINKFNTGVYSYTDSLTNSGGYSFANSTVCAIPSPIRPTYNWVTATSSEINWGANGDDSVLSSPVPIPFPFKFFGTTYNQFWIASNGWVSFTLPTASAAVQRTPADIPLSGGLDNYIAGLLTNLDLTNSTYSDVHTYYGGDATQMVVTYFHAHLAGSATQYITFQIILKENGDILVQYDNTQSTVPIATGLTNFCSVGIENAGGTKGLKYRFNGSGGSIFGSPLAVLFVAPQVALPVNLTSFTAQRNGRINNLSWTTSQEINTRYFVVERSSDGRNFSSLSRISAAGNGNQVTNYSSTDNTPAKGLNYYRLAITDVNGLVKYSLVKVIRNDGTADISIYPSPVKDVLHLVINSDAADKATLFITNLNGQLLQQQSLGVNKGINKLSINTDNLATGAYIIKVKMQADLVVKKFSKL